MTGTRQRSLEALPQQVRDDNQWRAEYEEMCAKPRLYGINSDDAIPEWLQVGMDETPLQYQARCKKTYVVDAGPGEGQQVRVRGGDKRCVTGTPVTSRDGSLILFQIIFRGKTSRYLPERSPGVHPAIYFDYSPSKYQTTSMFHDLVLLP